MEGQILSSEKNEGSSLGIPRGVEEVSEHVRGSRRIDLEEIVLGVDERLHSGGHERNLTRTQPMWRRIDEECEGEETLSWSLRWAAS